MDFNAVIQAISTVGFPIVCVIYLIYFQNKILKELQDTINTNSLTVQKLVDKLDVIDDTRKEAKK